MRVAVNSHALLVYIYIYKKNRISSLLCIFETTVVKSFASLATASDPLYNGSLAVAREDNSRTIL